MVSFPSPSSEPRFSKGSPSSRKSGTERTKQPLRSQPTQAGLVRVRFYPRRTKARPPRGALACEGGNKPLPFSAASLKELKLLLPVPGAQPSTRSCSWTGWLIPAMASEDFVLTKARLPYILKTKANKQTKKNILS